MTLPPRPTLLLPLCAGLCAGLCLAPGLATAHVALTQESAAADAWLGVRLVVEFVEALLPLLALGLALSGQLRRGAFPWPWALTGLAAGLLASPLADEMVSFYALGAGIFAAALIALRGLPLPAPVTAALAFALPALALASSYHGLTMLPPPAMLAGSLLAAAALVLLPALLGTLVLKLPGQAPGIALRIAASWLAAILILMLAFALAGPQAGL